MTGIVIAAGRGVRMQPYTVELPKCMLPVFGRSLLDYTIDSMRAAGCSRIVVITGHLAERIVAPGCILVHNSDYVSNNILHSLMYARRWFDDDLLVSYSDIIVEPRIYERLSTAAGEIVLAADRDWLGYYEGRSGHPLSEAEKAVVADCGRDRCDLLAIGKHLSHPEPGRLCTEFIGLMKMTRRGASTFTRRFDEIDRQLGASSPFEAAAEWRKAYVTDLLTNLVHHGVTVQCLLIERGWAELDAVQDYERLPSMIEKQKLFSLLQRKVATS